MPDTIITQNSVPVKYVDNGDGTFSPHTHTSGSTSIYTIPFDYVGVTYPNATTEVYTTRIGGSGGSIQEVITVVYTDSTKANLLSVARA